MDGQGRVDLEHGVNVHASCQSSICYEHYSKGLDSAAVTETKTEKRRGRDWATI